MSNLLDVLAFWRNPIFRRYSRSRLRLRSALIWYLLTIIVVSFVLSLSYVVMVNSDISPQNAARRMWVPLLVFQGLILMVKGTGAASAGIIQDKIDQTLDYQRLSPMSARRSLVGYLTGLPVLEHVMFALTLPHLLFVIIVGNIPLTAVVSVYVAFFVCVLLYHMTAIAVGLLMNRWVLGYLLSILTVLVINVILPITVPQLGVKFVQFFSVWPVISQKVIPVVTADLAMPPPENIFLTMGANVPFYNLELTPLVFTLLLQGALFVTFALIALRRWGLATRHSLSKPYSLFFLAGFIVLVLGNVWPIITGRNLPFMIFGTNDLDQLTEVIAVAFPGIFALLCWSLVGLLLATTVPDHDTCVRGLRRARKAGRKAPRFWEDESSNIVFMLAFVAIVLAGFGLLYSELHAAGFFDFRIDPEHGLWRLPLTLALVLTYSVLIIHVLELRLTVLVVLLVWFVPMLLAIVMGVAAQQTSLAQAVIASVSPIATLLMSSAVPLIGYVPIDAQNEFDLVLAGCATGIVMLFIQIVVLAVAWHRKTRAFSEKA